MPIQKLIVKGAIVSCALALTACSDSLAVVEQPTTLLSVDAQVVTQSDAYTVEREYVGVINSGQRANLGFELSGKVSKLWVDAGDAVKKGQPLVSLDTQLLDAELNELQAQLDEIKSQQKLTKANLNRQYTLKKKGFSSESEIDTLISQKEALAANHLRVNASIGANRLKLKKSTITAPYSGIVSKRFVSIGDVVGIGTSTLSLLSTDGKEAIIGVNSGDLQGIEAQAIHKVRVGNQEYSAELISKASNVDTTSRSVSLRFLLEEDAAVLDGELAYLSYQKTYPETGFWLPTTALIDGIRGTWNVYSLAPVDDHKSVERRVVQVLFANNDSVYVKGGLESGDQVITTGLHKVVPGQPVQVAVE
ncbi:efflux RND transporter periplasmic adaptor subunit [Vibrio sp. T187]|uniref:efflux RND transporter periplasmic adaptor subunit n=1 Tax=Vibrio TaxID=662 RepID=UPI0010C94F25|nr:MULTISPECIES: efflux RND transporter periplasmic adaptor subunit [Vibrio]MBW3695839.1 efflux RND transporter periplasmic adaptor subunit [Vibrio sp. T187]